MSKLLCSRVNFLRPKTLKLQSIDLLDRIASSLADVRIYCDPSPPALKSACRLESIAVTSPGTESIGVVEGGCSVDCALFGGGTADAAMLGVISGRVGSYSSTVLPESSANAGGSLFSRLGQVNASRTPVQ